MVKIQYLKLWGIDHTAISSLGGGGGGGIGAQNNSNMAVGQIRRHVPQRNVGLETLVVTFEYNIKLPSRHNFHDFAKQY